MDEGSRDREPSRAPVPVRARVLAAIGAVVLLASVDLALGAAWGALAPTDPVVGFPGDRINLSGTTETERDHRASSLAMEDAPWADAYFRELQLTRFEFWPYTVTRPLDFDGEYVTVTDWARRSYEPEPLPEVEVPVVWLFGGSTAWGVGQRDEFTMASQIARISEQEGLPVQVVNFGQRGWVHLQEMLLFEQLLAARPAPELAVFYDGVNDLAAAMDSVDGAPTHRWAGAMAGVLGQGHDIASARGSDSSLRSIGGWYLERSAVARLLRAIGGAFIGEASADEGSADEPEGTAAQGAVRLYERARSLTLAVAEQHGVSPQFYWHPFAHFGGARAADHLTPPTVDLSDALDGSQQVYIDAAHTNEDGAAIVAGRIWDELRPVVRTWYSARGVEGRAEAGQSLPARRTPEPNGRALLDRARQQVAVLSADPCAIHTSTDLIGAIQVDDRAEAVEFAGVVRTYLRTLAKWAPPALAGSVALLDAAADEVADAAESVEIDPDLRLLPQLTVNVGAEVFEAAEDLEQAADAACRLRS